MTIDIRSLKRITHAASPGLSDLDVPDEDVALVFEDDEV